jgi:hypothetical protein
MGASLGQEEVRLGQLSKESFERNEWAYLHRSYEKYVVGQTPQEKAARGRAIRLWADSYKGRGIEDVEGVARLRKANDTWWGRKVDRTKPDYGMAGQKFLRLERRENRGEGVAVLPGMEQTEQKGRLREVIYWPADEALPDRFKSWDQDAAQWEARVNRKGKLVMWRDFTQGGASAHGRDRRHPLRDGEDAAPWHPQRRGRALPGVAGEQLRPPGRQAARRREEARRARGNALRLRQGRLGAGARRGSGRYRREEVRQARRAVGARPGVERRAPDHEPQVRAARRVLRQRPEGVEDQQDGALAGGAHEQRDGERHHGRLARRQLGGRAEGASARCSRRSAATPRRSALIDRFEDAGGTQGMYVLSEIQRDQLAPILDEIETTMRDAGEQNAMVGLSAALHLLLAEAVARRARRAAGVGRHPRAGQGGADHDGHLRGRGSGVPHGRLHARVADGKSDREAGKLARKSFLDYQINAPWIQLARQTAFPFISFVYRALPMLAETAARKPWKLLKLAIVLGAANMLGYALSGGDEDDERKLLPEEKAGRILGFLGPKLVRMPWNDAHDSPVFLDIRRFIPLGDIVDFGQTHSACPSRRRGAGRPASPSWPSS